MTTRMKETGRKPGQMGDKRLAEMSDTEQRHAMYRGCTISDLEIIFKMDRRTILSRLTDCKPSGKRGQAETFLIRDVAPYLVKPAGDMEEFIKRARPQDLSPLLLKEYWNGQRAKQAFLEGEGQLWRTERVFQLFAEAFKSVRTSLLLIPDELERKSALTDVQRDELMALVDTTLNRLREDLTAQFDGEPSHDDAPGTGNDDPDAPREDAGDDDADFWATPEPDVFDDGTRDTTFD